MTKSSSSDPSPTSPRSYPLGRRATRHIVTMAGLMAAMAVTVAGCGRSGASGNEPAPSAPAPTGANYGQTAAYTCPMHPEVVSDKPGRCPKCGMDLAARK